MHYRQQSDELTSFEGVFLPYFFRATRRRIGLVSKSEAIVLQRDPA